MKRKLILVILFAALFCGQASFGQAQSTNPTPQAEQSFIQQWSQEVIFPSAVRFTITLALPLEQVSTVSLIIKPASRPTVNVPLNLESTVVVGGEITGLAYIWQLPLENPPLLFKDIVFDWQVTSQTGDTAKIEDHFTFTDQRVNWLQDLPISSTVKLTLPNDMTSKKIPSTPYSHTGLDDLAANIKHVAALLSTNLGSTPNFNLLVYDTSKLPICTTNTKGESVATSSDGSIQIPCATTSADQIFAASGYNTVIVKSSSLTDVETAISDYMVTQSYTPRWSGKSVPQWFQTGLTDFYSPSLKVEMGPPVLSAARSNNLLPLDVMAQSPTTDANSELWRAQSYGLVVYIASQIGVDGLFNLANDAGTSASFDEAYQTALGKPISTLLDNFQRWLFTSSALDAFTFTPYQAATASPTPSRTLTLTNTPTTTPTATFTLTPTVTGVLSLTPLPSRTPTRTPTAAPPTNTPRAAGSLNTPLPPLEKIATNSNLNLGIVILLVGIIIVAAAAFILFRPRR
ncbi:MAG: hypothetical protein GC179_09850 [Anaerolineaceae bacterium]|nr:hypothetical protein [Anaerolineaceae bacterium]